jgi:hypothetical protein
MADVDSIQLSAFVCADDPVAVLEESSALWAALYPGRGFATVLHAFDAVRSLYAGEYPGYHACDTGYHDFKHTVAVFLAAVRLVDGCWASGAALPPLLAHDVLVAALFHDAGYIRKLGEEGYTGARFTAAHVGRSVQFIQENAKALELERHDDIARLVWSTGLKDEFSRQAWSSDEEHMAGALLASADLIGQMGDRAYLEKLLFLYYEFREAGIPGYNTEFDILRSTLSFYELTVARLDGPLLGMRHYARAHCRLRYGVDRDLYEDAMERQMDYLRDILDDDSTNFRKKLKRMDLEKLDSAAQNAIA